MDAAIVTALETQLATAAGWPVSAWEKINKAFTPVRGTPWGRSSILWGTEELQSIPASGGHVTRTGILSLEYFGALDTGAAVIDALVDGIRAAFPVGSFLAVAGGSYLRIDRLRRWAPDRDDRNWLHQPVDIEWTMNYTNPTF